MEGAAGRGWVLALTPVASLMVALDTLVVATALSTIRLDLARRSRSSNGRSTRTTSASPCC